MRMGHYVPWSTFACILGVAHAALALTTPMHQHQLEEQYPAQAAFAHDQQQLLTVSPSAGQQLGFGFNYSEWDFAQGPSPNATGHLVFDTVRSFLQHWPNTRYRNGHTIVPGTIPPGTLLYHGSNKPVVPAVPEWTATDPEHSYLFCREPMRANDNNTLPSSPSPSSSSNTEPEGEGCWHLTLSTTRALKVLYFDGSSAAKMLGGPMDTQDLLAWGRIWDEKVFAERERLDLLCRWAREGGRGIDGFVRMEMDFEVMLCDFTAGVEVVSFLNLNPVIRSRSPRPRSPPPSPNAAGIQPENSLSGTRPGPSTYVLEAGSWHNAYPGETRVVLDYTKFISFYDTQLFPGLAKKRVGVPRLKHHLEGLDEGQLEGFRRRLDGAFKEGEGKNEGSGSGVDWRTLYQSIAERYAERLDRLPYILNVTADQSADVEEEEGRNRSAQAHRAVTSMLFPYILHTSVPPSTSANSSGSGSGIADPEHAHAWAAPVWAHCAAAHTKALARPALAARMTAAERLLLGAAREVEREICRVLVSVWAEGRELGFGGDESEDAGGDKVKYAELAAGWRERVDGLMGWLDWSVDWLKCRPACGFEELCVLPTWPFFSRSPFPRRPPNRTVDHTLDREEEPENEWEDPQPKCMPVMESLENTGDDDEF